MSLTSFLANKCFEFLLNCEGKGSGHRFPSDRKTGRIAPSLPVIPPPWAIAEQDFLAKCDGCGACIEYCENAILVPDGNGRPLVDFSRGPCTFCGACAENCPREAFMPWRERPLWDIKAWVSGNCLAQNNVLCRTCAEHCPEAAIVFPPRSAAVTTPMILAERCSGCGACFGPCPVGAIIMGKQGDNITYRGGG